MTNEERALKILEAFHKDYDCMPGAVNYRLANAIRELVEPLYGDGTYYGEEEQEKFEIADEFNEIADELEALIDGTNTPIVSDETMNEILKNGVTK